MSGDRSPFTHRTCACAFLEALCRVLCHCSALGRGKGQWKRSPFTHRARACASLEALCRWRSQFSAFGARTGRALQDCFHAEHELSTCFTFGEGPSRGHRQRVNNGFARRHPSPPLAQHSPCPKAPLPEGSSPMAQHSLCLWAVRSSFAVRAPCAHQRKRSAAHMVKRFQRRRGGGLGRERFVRITRPFPAAHQRKRSAAHMAKRFQRRRGGGVGRERIVRIARPFSCEITVRNGRANGGTLGTAGSGGTPLPPAAPTAPPTMANNLASCKGCDPQTHPLPSRGKTRDNCGRAGNDTHLP